MALYHTAVIILIQMSRGYWIRPLIRCIVSKLQCSVCVIVQMTCVRDGGLFGKSLSLAYCHGDFIVDLYTW